MVYGKPESAQENETHKIVWDLEARKDYQILARGPGPLLISNKRRTCQQVVFAVSADHTVKNERMCKYLDIARELKSCGTWKSQWYQLYLEMSGLQSPEKKKIEVTAD